MASDPLDLNQLLRQNKQLARRVNILFSCSITLTVLLALALYGFSRNGVFHVHGLAVVDAAGKTRVLLQAPLPEPIMMGKQGKRDDSVSGVMICDALGNECGGYVTDNSVGNAFLSWPMLLSARITTLSF